MCWIVRWISRSSQWLSLDHQLIVTVDLLKRRRQVGRKTTFNRKTSTPPQNQVHTTVVKIDQQMGQKLCDSAYKKQTYICIQDEERGQYAKHMHPEHKDRYTSSKCTLNRHSSSNRWHLSCVALEHGDMAVNKCTAARHLYIDTSFTWQRWIACLAV